MTLEPESTGTTEEATGTTAQAADGSTIPAADGSGGGETAEEKIARLERLHQQDLSRLNAVEEATRRTQELEQQVADLSARVGTGSTPPTATAPNAQQEWQTLTYRLALGDPTLTQEERDRLQAYALWRQEQLAQQSARQTRDSAQMAQIPLADHAEVQKLYQSGRYADPLAAYDGVLADRFRKGTKEREEQAASAQREREARARGVVASAPATAVPAAALTNGTIKRADWLTACANAERGDAAAKKVLDQYDRGQLRIVDS